MPCRVAFNLDNRTKWAVVYGAKEVSAAISPESLVIGAKGQSRLMITMERRGAGSGPAGEAPDLRRNQI